MSKKSNTETETEVSENLVEQSELDGLSSESSTSEVTESKSVVTSTATTVKVNTVAKTAVKSNQKMNVTRFLLYYPQDVYISALLKRRYPKNYFTVDEWFQRIEEILNTPIYS